MSSPRPVRIARPAPTTEARPRRARRRADPESDAPGWRPNTAGSQRAVHLAELFVGAIVVLYAVLAVLDRTGPDGSTPGATVGLLIFTFLAVVLGLCGVVFALSQAPRGVEVTADATVVVGRFGRRTEYPPLARLKAREVRRFAPGILARAPVLLVELRTASGRPSNVLLEDGLIPVAGRPSDD